MTVYLVGAGPGDVELLTLKAAAAIQRADVVVFDRLVGREILNLAPPEAELIPVGKDPDGQRCDQVDINRILVDRGRTNRTVVRLKGGDPFVFGRGGEEALDLLAADVSFEIVPGISSAVAGPALAGIPVTHRGLSHGFTVVTGHTASTSDQVNWCALAKSGMTLLVLMGARNARSISRNLIAGGLDAATPTAVVTRAATPIQTVRRLPLGELGIRRIDNPSVIVIGSVADLDLDSNLFSPSNDQTSVRTPVTIS